MECNDCEETEFVVYLNVYATESESTDKHQIHICVKYSLVFVCNIYGKFYELNYSS